MAEWCWESGGGHAGVLLLAGLFLTFVFGMAWNFLINDQEAGLSDPPSTRPSSHRLPGKPKVRSTTERKRFGWRDLWDWAVILALTTWLIWGIAEGRADWESLAVVFGALSFLGILGFLLDRYGLRRTTAHATLVVVRGLFAVGILTAAAGVYVGIHTGRAC